MFSPAVVLACLLEEFGPSDTSRVPTRQEKKMVSSFASILRDAQCGCVEVEDEEGISAESEEDQKRRRYQRHPNVLLVDNWKPFKDHETIPSVL
ncbi:unnamed protein product [Heligmosomoides polygyrus]|uniref:Secreted protein n=1 Tax=Heligmosomoides polygyrus TaxID=6339 RepID=A0A183FE07_HELPZ|nr:unnamed protein product [Heligmosomoides polygyrus]